MTDPDLNLLVTLDVLLAEPDRGSSARGLLSPAPGREGLPESGSSLPDPDGGAGDEVTGGELVGEVVHAVTSIWTVQ